MLSEEDKLEIKNEIRSCFEEILNSQGITLAEHTKDHYFVSNLRNGVAQMRRATWWSIIVTLVPAILYLIWCAITNHKF